MKKVLFFLTAFTVGLFSYGQRICGFDDLHKYEMEHDPSYAQRVNKNDQLIREYVSRHPELKIPARTSQTVYTIPVVVHVMHTGGQIGSIYNPTDQQIMAAVEYMNNVYSGAYPWVGGTSGAKDIGLRFVLAKRDPNCMPTTGIVRVNASVLTNYSQSGLAKPSGNSAGSGAPELSIKNLSRWDPRLYYNIWIVNKINGADGNSPGQYIAGFAYLPDAVTPERDGTVVLASNFATTTGNDKTLTHEIGHAFGLYHPFSPNENVVACPSNASCDKDGDQVCDTDPITVNIVDGKYVFTCRTGINSCTNTNFSELTESNFMNYTDCFTLFTPGQKARMLAALNLPTRVSLATSTGSIAPDQSPACPANINFSVASTVVKETRDVISSCSGYMDFNYSMSIVSPPSSEATVTFMPGGTAANGIDYTIFTQGNLSTPSNTIIFPPGSNTNQNFTIRVKDDADVEPTENILLDYSVSGGGALKGNVVPLLNITLNDNDSLPSTPNALVNYPVGSFNANLSQQLTPFRAEKTKHRMQSLYLASELLAAGLKPNQPIAGIGLNVITKNSTTAFSNFSVSLGHWSISNTINNFRTLSEVYSGTINTSIGLNQIVFNSPFVWDGTSNLIVQFCFNNAAGQQTSSNDIVQGEDNALGSGVIASCLADFTTETVAGCSLPRISALNSTLRPTIQLYTLSAGNAVVNSISSSQLELGPNADVYFFNNAGQILARIKNLSSFDYGCTTVEVDRNGTTTSPFWSTNPLNGLSQKTFKVTPQNPNPNGSYEISLYYSDSEKTGYVNATGQSWSTVQMVKSNGAISSITPSNQQASTVTVNTGAAKSTYGLDHVVTAAFNNGFSGFAVGSPGTATSLNDLNVLNGVRVYPNPVSKQFTIGFDRPQRNLSVRIISAEGRILHTERINGIVQTHSIQMNQLIKGLYMLEIISDEGKKVLPLVKQ